MVDIAVLPRYGSTLVGSGVLRLALVALAALLTAGCQPAPPPPPELAAVVAYVWPEDSAPRQYNVTWRVGDPGDGNAGFTEARCLVTCWFTITIRPDLLTSYYLVAHEGGHVVCAVRSWDWSEECADAEALARLGG